MARRRTLMTSFKPADLPSRKAGTLSDEERVENILGCRLDRPIARQCAADLAAAGLPSTDRAWAITLLEEHMPHVRAVACANDLAMSGLVPRQEDRS